MRIAWIGPTPSEDGGGPFVGTQLLQGLVAAGAEVDCFVAARPEDMPPRLTGLPGLDLVLADSGWRWGRWYSRHPMVAFFSGNAARLLAQRSLADRVAERHRARPYDVLYQFSQTELTALRRRARELPPIVLHPSTHAAGELFWHRAESELSRRCEPARKRLLVRAMLSARARAQRRDVQLARRVLGVSARFAEHLARDYRIPAERLGVVPNPIDLDRFRPPPTAPSATAPLDLLFVSRMSARKGVELVVDLSHRIADLAGAVRIRAVGGPTSWSDYRRLLADLNPATAVDEGQMSPFHLSLLYGTAGAVLQPSRYEPFALTVGEALASGTPVVASDEVGAIDGVDPAVCRVFPSGDAEAFEYAVRTLVEDISGPAETSLRTLARAEAERLFGIERITGLLLDELARAIGRV